MRAVIRAATVTMLLKKAWKEIGELKEKVRALEAELALKKTHLMEGDDCDCRCKDCREGRHIECCGYENCEIPEEVLVVGIEPSGSDFLDYMMPRLLVIAMAVIMLVVALTLILDGTLGWGFVLMAMFLLMVGMNLIVVSPSSRNEYDMPLLAGIGFHLLGASFVVFLFGLWFLTHPPVGIP